MSVIAGYPVNLRERPPEPKLQFRAGSEPQMLLGGDEATCRRFLRLLAAHIIEPSVLK